MAMLSLEPAIGKQARPTTQLSNHSTCGTGLYRTLTHPLKLIPGRTAHHVIVIKRSQMIYYTTFVSELTLVSPETTTARSMKTIS